MNIDSAVEQLRAAERDMRDDPPNSIEHKDSVLDEYRPLFQPDEVGSLTEQEFKKFLLFENNRHWTGLHRKRSMMTDDMDRLRDGLQTLVDEEQDLASRVQTTKETVDGIGKATISAILVTAYPEKYGVWNNRSDLQVYTYINGPHLLRSVDNQVLDAGYTPSSVPLQPRLNNPSAN